MNIVYEGVVKKTNYFWAYFYIFFKFMYYVTPISYFSDATFSLAFL